MSLNRKELSILEELNKSIKISLTYFAEKYNVSERNIRYSIENLNYYLLKFSLAEIKIKKGEVYWSIEQENLKNFIESIDIENYIFSKEERENYILISYLFSDRTKITDIERYLKISRPTIKKDLISLNSYLKEFELEFLREEHTIFIVGKEKKLRHLKLLKLLEYLDIKNGKVEYLEKIYLTEKKELEIVKRYLEKFDIPKYYNIILQIERELKVEFDTKFKKLICIYLISTIERIDKNFIITKKDNSKFLSQLTDYKIIKNILKNIIPEELEFEFLHLTEYFISGYYSHDFSENIYLVESFIDAFCGKIKKELEFEFFNSQDFREEVLKYLLPAVYRIKNNFFLLKKDEKPNVDKDIYTIVKSVVLDCNHILKEPFREDEIYFLTNKIEKYIKIEQDKKISFKKLLEIIKKCSLDLDEKKLKEEIIKVFKDKIEFE